MQCAQGPSCHLDTRSFRRLQALRELLRTCPLRPHAGIDTMKRKPSPGEPDEAIIIPEPTSESRNQLQQSTFVIAALLLSPSIGFCWWLMLVSFVVAYHYALFVVRSWRRPLECSLLSVETVGFALTTGFQLVLLAGVALWCLSLTPAHLFMPTAADLWMPYAIHDPLHMTQTMYDPGKAATVECVRSHPVSERWELSADLAG